MQGNKLNCYFLKVFLLVFGNSLKLFSTFRLHSVAFVVQVNVNVSLLRLASCILVKSTVKLTGHLGPFLHYLSYFCEKTSTNLAAPKVKRKYTLYINNSLHLARKYARIFACCHYLSRKTNSFSKAKLQEN